MRYVDAFDKKEISKLESAITAYLYKLQNAVNEEVITGTENVYKYSQVRVPVDTSTLKQSNEIMPYEYNLQQGIGTIKGEVIYGGNGNPINPKSLTRASNYMLTPGEDKRNHDGKILTDGFNKIAPQIVDKIKTAIKNN